VEANPERFDVTRGALLLDSGTCDNPDSTPLVVVDIDVRNDAAVGELTEWVEHKFGPARWQVTTPSGGRHLYYRADPSEVVAPRAGLLGTPEMLSAADGSLPTTPIDVRGGRSYAVAPGSEGYRWRVIGPPITDVDSLQASIERLTPFDVERYEALVEAVRVARGGALDSAGAVAVRPLRPPTRVWTGGDFEKRYISPETVVELGQPGQWGRLGRKSLMEIAIDLPSNTDQPIRCPVHDHEPSSAATVRWVGWSCRFRCWGSCQTDFYFLGPQAARLC
jgi:hypothetical protein